MGNPWVSYYDDTSDNLRVARYVGSGGSGCASSAWNCTTVDSSNDVGSGSSIAIDSSGNPWVSYVDITNDNLRVAHYVGSGGSCASSAWDCASVASMGSLASGKTSITIDPSDKPWVAFRYDFSLDPTWAVMSAHYVGSGGSGCIISSVWDCTTVQLVNQTEENNPSIALDSSGDPWVSFFIGNSQNDLIVAHYVSSGGNCGTGNAWSCTSVETTGNSGQYSSIAIDANGNPVVAYEQITTVPVQRKLQIARYVGGGNGSGCFDGDWVCTSVDLVDTNGAFTSIAIDSAGNPWVAYSSGDLKIARYVGGSSGSGCSDSAWTCTAMESSGYLGQYSSIAFDNYGKPIVSYYDATNADLRVAKLDDRAGELLISPASGGRWGDSLNESHADMSSISDTSNRDDADCIGGGTWTNGTLAISENVAKSLTDAHCTEITLTIDTSQAVVGRTYRIILSTNDNWRKDKGLWRGLSSYDQYATITISDSMMRAGKDNSPQFANCSNTSWGCSAVETTGDTGLYTSTVMDADGNPWISYYDQANDTLKAAHYVGSGGSGCASSAWNCDVIDPSGGTSTSIALDPSGTPWISYAFSNGLAVAKYVGSGGTCGNWDCFMYIHTGVGINGTGITFDANGNPLIVYSNTSATDLYIAKYVGSGGSGCSDNAWTCTPIDTSSNVGWDVSIANGPAGIWITYYDISSTSMKTAHYVGSGGSGCASSAWTCVTVDNATASGVDSSTAVDASGNPWISYYQSGSNFDLKVAHYVGSGGSGCSIGSTWDCDSVDVSGDTGNGNSIAIDSAGNPWVSYYDSSNSKLRVARYVTSSGSGCNDSAWTCVDVNNINGQFSSIAFDDTGSPWVSYANYNGTNMDLQVAKLHRPTNPFSLANQNNFKGYNAGQSFARHRLSPGASPNSSDGACGSAITDYMGTCAWFQSNGQYDTVVAQANESPYLTAAVKYSGTSQAPTIKWSGRSTYAPNTAGTAGDITLQIYRFGSTNAWETVASDTASSDCNTPSAGNCTISGMPSGTPSDYYYDDGSGGYWVYCRLYQGPNTGGTITLKTDQLGAYITQGRLRHGQSIEGGITRPMNWR
jgi:hypothetical protein